MPSHELHSGGYAYRLAPANSPLTEETFRKIPLDFVGPSTLRWDGNKSTDLKFDTKLKGWETSVGTMPAGSTWRKNPIPSGLWQREGPTFEPGDSPTCIALVGMLILQSSSLAGLSSVSFPWFSVL